MSARTRRLLRVVGVLAAVVVVVVGSLGVAWRMFIATGSSGCSAQDRADLLQVARELRTELGDGEVHFVDDCSRDMRGSANWTYRSDRLPELLDRARADVSCTPIATADDDLAAALECPVRGQMFVLWFEAGGPGESEMGVRFADDASAGAALRHNGVISDTVEAWL